MAELEPTGGYEEALTADDPVELYETAPCGYLSARPDGTITKSNRTFQHWTGYGADELRDGRTFQSLLPVGDRIYFETHLAPLLSMQGSVREIALEILCADSRRLPVLVNATTAHGPDDTPLRIRLAVFDARERRAYERELVAARDAAAEAARQARTLAETLQQTLLPPSLPTIPGVELGAAYRPAGDGSIVGGDFYDVFEIGDERWGIAIGDVCGKGADAAVITALARYTIRAAAVGTPSPSEALRALHDAIERDRTNGFCTALFLTVDVEGPSPAVTVSAGGHHLPLLRRAGSITEVGRTGSLLGMLGPPRLHDVSFALEPGDVLVLFTDGVLEAGTPGNLFGERRLHETILAADQSPAGTVAHAVEAAAIAFQDGVARDDIAVVSIRAAG